MIDSHLSRLLCASRISPNLFLNPQWRGHNGDLINFMVPELSLSCLLCSPERTSNYFYLLVPVYALESRNSSCWKKIQFSNPPGRTWAWNLTLFNLYVPASRGCACCVGGWGGVWVPYLESVMSYVWQQEDKVGCQSLSPALLETGSLVCLFGHQASCLWAFRDSPISVSHPTIGTLGL